MICACRPSPAAPVREVLGTMQREPANEPGARPRVKCTGYHSSMRLRLIRLLAIVVALAVPLQGLAAVVAGQCMAFGHHSTSGESHSHGQGSQDGHVEAGDEGDGTGAHCGPCTACCASASIAGRTGLSILSSPSSATYVFSPFPPIGVQPDRLDRPPLAL